MNFLPNFCDVRNLRHLALKDVRIKRSRWRAIIDKIKSRLDLTSLDMNHLCDGKRWEENSKVYIDDKNNVNNFLHSKEPHFFLDNATAFCTKDSIKIFEVFWHDLFEDYD